MNLPSNSVVVFHPGKQHAYQVVLALQRAGLLHCFVTGIYFKPRTFPYKLVRRLPHGSRGRIEGELQKRYLKELENDRIISIPYFEALSRLIGRIQPLMTMTEGHEYLLNSWLSDYYISHWIKRCRPKPAMLYGFIGSALRSFPAAKQLGIVTVLDVPITLHALSIMAQEKQKLGMKTRYKEIGPRLLNEVRMADYIITPSEAVAESVVDYGVVPSKVKIIPFGVDVSQFQAQKTNQEVTSRKFRVLFVGKFDLRKGIHHLLESWQQLALPESELIVVGPPGEVNFVSTMRTKYAGQFIERGNVPHSQLPELFAQADLFVFPSLAEGSALVTYEALSSGLPCIVTHEAGSVVRDGIEGFVVPTGDIQTLAERISQLYYDKQLRERMGVAARQRAEEFTWERYHTKLVDTLHHVSRVNSGKK